MQFSGLWTRQFRLYIFTRTVTYEKEILCTILRLLHYLRILYNNEYQKVWWTHWNGLMKFKYFLVVFDISKEGNQSSNIAFLWNSVVCRWMNFSWFINNTLIKHENHFKLVIRFEFHLAINRQNDSKAAIRDLSKFLTATLILCDPWMCVVVNYPDDRP